MLGFSLYFVQYKKPISNAQESTLTLCTIPGSNQCKRCVIDKLAIVCPYPKDGNVDCEKQKACALATQFDCPEASK
jgi:hypothetical protein